MKIHLLSQILEYSPLPPEHPRKWLKQILKPLHSARRQLLTLSLAVNLLSLAVPVFVLQVYDRVIFHNGLTTLQGLLIGILIVLLFEFLLRRGRTRILQHCGIQINQQLGQILFTKITSLPLRTLEKHPASYWQMLFHDLDLVRSRHSGPTAMLLFDLPFTLLAIALVVTIATPIAWVLLLLIPLFLLIALRSARNTHKQSTQERENIIQRDQLVAEFSNIRNSIKALVQDDYFANRWDQQQKHWSEDALEHASSSDRYRDLGQTLSMATTVILTSVGALAILEQQLTLGALIATNMLSSKIIAPLTQLITQWSQLAQYKSAKHHLNTLFEEDSERMESSVKPSWVIGRLSFEKLAFSYHDNHPLIESLSGKIGPNGIHAIVGPNGSGKSTLLKLLCGLYTPDQGRVLLDDADIQQYTRTDLRNWIGYLPQHATPLADSIYHNLTIHRPDANNDEIIEACQLANAYGFISQLEEGFSTNMGENGHRFSGGERKRIAIASLFLSKPKILVLDEPTSDLDIEAEKSLANTLQQLAADHTILLVTHSPLLLRVSNSIMLLQQGRIRAAGATQDMLKQLGIES